jgi:hypothetical protein
MSWRKEGRNDFPRKKIAKQLELWLENQFAMCERREEKWDQVGLVSEAAFYSGHKLALVRIAKQLRICGLDVKVRGL